MHFLDLNPAILAGGFQCLHRFILPLYLVGNNSIKKNVNIPVIVVSEIFTGEQAQYLVENEYADFVAIGRGLFTDENWANKVLAGEPINQCRNCGDNMRKCMWFFDHTKCSARKVVKPLIVT